MAAYYTRARRWSSWNAPLDTTVGSATAVLPYPSSALTADTPASVCALQPLLPPCVHCSPSSLHRCLLVAASLSAPLRPSIPPPSSPSFPSSPFRSAASATCEQSTPWSQRGASPPPWLPPSRREQRWRYSAHTRREESSAGGTVHTLAGKRGGLVVQCTHAQGRE